MGFTTGITNTFHIGLPHYYIQGGGCDGCACELGLDIAISMDYTGSMAYIIEAVKGYIGDVAQAVDDIVIDGKIYRLALQLTDEYWWNEDINDWQGTLCSCGYQAPPYENAGEYITLPSVNKFTNHGPQLGQLNVSFGTEENDYYHATQLLTTMESFQDNNVSTFTTQLNKTNNNSTGMLPLGQGVGYAEPYDLAIERMIDGSDGVGAWRKGIVRIGITYADSASSGEDDYFDITDKYNMQYYMPAKCRINNIRWCRFGNAAETALYKWPDLCIATDGEYDNDYDKGTVIDAITAICRRGEIPYRMVDGNGDLKTLELVPRSWYCQYDEMGDIYLEFDDYDVFTPTGDGFTISLWVKPDELTSTKMLYKDSEWEIGTDSNDDLFFSITTNNGVMKITPTSNPMTLDWQHIVCTWDGTFADTDGMTIYHSDGEEDGAGTTTNVYNDTNVTDDSTGSTGTTVTNSSNKIMCSSNGDGNIPADYEGRISDIAIYKTALDSTQIALITNGGRPQNLHSLHADIDPDNLLGYWRPFQNVNKKIYGYLARDGKFKNSASTNGLSTHWSTSTPSTEGNHSNT